MKKFYKVCLITGLCLLLTGVTLFGAAFAAGARNFIIPTNVISIDKEGISFFRKTVITLPGYQGGETPMNSHTVQGTAKSLLLDVAGLNVTVKTGPDYAVEAPEGLDIRYGIKDGVFQVECPDIQFTFFGWNIGNIAGHVPVTVTLPAGEYENINIRLGVGEVTVEKGLSCKNLRAETGAGTILLQQIDVLRTGEFICGMGKLTYSGKGADDMRLDCGMGRIDITLTDGRLADYRTVVQCGMGSVKIGAQSFSGMGVDTVLNLDAQKKLEIDCGMGVVNIQE